MLGSYTSTSLLLEAAAEAGFFFEMAQVGAANTLFYLPLLPRTICAFFVFLDLPCIDSAGGHLQARLRGRQRPGEARFFPWNSPAAVHLAGWNRMHREQTADFFFQEASWPPKHKSGLTLWCHQYMKTARAPCRHLKSSGQLLACRELRIVATLGGCLLVHSQGTAGSMHLSPEL